MPLYEYVCNKCVKIDEKLFKKLEVASKTIRCTDPKCDGKMLRQAPTCSFVIRK
jgi:predicted nucleic acid-binding Zn ribbon protein